MTPEQQQEEYCSLPHGDYPSVGAAVIGFNWPERASTATIDKELWSFFRSATWHVRLWPGDDLGALARNPEKDSQFLTPEVTCRERHGVRFYEFGLNSARFHLVVNARESELTLFRHGNNYPGYMEFAWGSAPVNNNTPT